VFVILATALTEVTRRSTAQQRLDLCLDICHIDIVSLFVMPNYLGALYLRSLKAAG